MKFGINSWADLLAKFKEGSIRFWAYVADRIPQLIEALSSIFTTLRDALGGGVVDTIVGWLTRGFEWLINDAPGVVAKAVEFMGDLFDLAGYVWGWLKGIDWNELLGMVRTKFDEFKTALSGLDSLPVVVSELGQVRAAIDGVTTAIGGVERKIENLRETMKYTMAIVGGAIIGGIVSAIAAPIGLKFLAGMAGAALGGGIGATIAGYFHGGGVVPGPMGSPQLIMAAGGEEVLTYRQRQGPSSVLVENHIYLSGEEVSDLVIERVRHTSKSMTGRYATAAGLTGRM